MRKYLFIIILITMFALTAGAMVFMFGRHDEHWTTSSRQALEEFRLGLQDEQRFYRADALGHYAKALELDPDFVMARVKVTQLGDDLSPERWLEFIDSLDLEDLSERERTLIAIRVARLRRERDTAEKLIAGYLARHPHDSHILFVSCESAWAAQDWQKARECYEHVIEVDPNWVSAINNLGYIAMAQGRMDDAYDHFTTYRYIAPDQANPHDSMGELLTLLGRYDEAREQFLRAVELRPDYCASWEHLMLLENMRGRLGQFGADLERARRESGCERSVRLGKCALDILEAGPSGSSAREVIERPDCSDRLPGDVLVQAYMVELAAGRSEDLAALESLARERGQGKNPLLTHMSGARALEAGKYRAAAKAFEEIDEILVWFGDGQGLFKVYNRAALVVALEGAGERERAATLAEETRKINAQLFDRSIESLRAL